MQRYRVVILIVLFGVVPVVAAFFAALSFLEENAAEPVPIAAEAAPPPAAPPEERKVLAAARELPVGTLIGEGDLTGVALDAKAVRRDHIVVDDDDEEAADHDHLRGYAVREALASGEVFVRSAVVGPRQRGFLAAVLRPGARAVTIQVGPATSHAGLIDPGDRVDVILSAEVQSTDRERSVLARTIVEDVRVVAVDRRVGNGGGAPGEASGASGADGAFERTEMITATLEVSPEQGDRLVLGEHEGKLSLAVRSLAVAGGRTASPAVELNELMLSPIDEPPPALPEASDGAGALEERLQAQLAALEERLRARRDEPAPKSVAPPAGDDAPLRTVRVFRGNHPAEEVLFLGGD